MMPTYCYMLTIGVCLILAADVSAEHYNVVLFGGQSNMAGTAAALELPGSLSPQTDIEFYYQIDALSSVDSNMSMWIDLQTRGQSRPSGGFFGPEMTFGRTIADALPGQNLAIIKHAEPSTDLHTEWDPDTGNVYANFQNTVAAGLNALTALGHTYEISAMLWTQGESDASSLSTTYESNLNDFITDIRTNYGTNLPFYLNELSSQQTGLNATGLANVKTAQTNVAASDPFTYLIDTDDMSMSSDGIHFDAAGQVQLGNAFGQAYLAGSDVFSTSLLPVADERGRSVESSGLNAGSTSNLAVGAVNGSNDTFRTYLTYDLTSEKAAASVTLTLDGSIGSENNTSTQTHTFTLVLLSSDWNGESDPGPDGIALATTELVISSGNDTKDLIFTSEALTQAFNNARGGNIYLGIKSDIETSVVGTRSFKWFGSLEDSGQEPTLFYSYTVPEPTSTVLLALGTTMIAMRRRSRDHLAQPTKRSS